VTDAMSGAVVSALLTRAELTGLRFPVVESLYADRAPSGASSGVRLHAVYCISPELRPRNIEAGLPGTATEVAASEAFLLRDMRQYASPEQWEESVRVAVKAEVLPPAAERCVLLWFSSQWHWHRP
jgi:hypothetical protein